MKKWLKEYFGYTQNLIAWASVLFLAGIFYLVLFATPRIGAADFGEYDQTLYRMGLSRLAADEADTENRYFTRVIEEYQIDGVEESRLLGTTPTESMVYPVALISMVCRLFQTNFNTRYLALFYCAMVLGAIYILCKALYFRLGNKVLLIPLFSAVCLFSSDNITMFNSLYSDGMVIPSFLLFLAMYVRAIVSKQTRGGSNTIPVFITAYLFLTANDSMPYLGIVVLPFLIYMCYVNHTSEKKKVLYHYLLSSAGCLLLTAGCFHFITENEALNAHVNLYSATFNGAFVEAEDQAEALNYFGLSAELQEDIGKSYYLSEEEYVVAPYTEKAETVLYQQLSYSKLLGYYIKHPDVFWKVLNQNLSVTKRVNLERYLYINKDGTSNPDSRVEKMGYYAFLRRFFVPESAASLFIVFGVALLGIFSIYLYQWRKKQNRFLCYFLLLLLLFTMGRLLLTTFLYGTFENTFRLYSYMVLYDFSVLAFVVSAIQILYSFSVFLNEKKEMTDRLPEEPVYAICTDGPVSFLKKKAKQALVWCDHRIFGKQKWAVLTISAMAALIMLYVLFLPERIGAYNNGDFGRMMDAMGLYYNEYDLLHQEEQYVTKITEEYVWLDTFDWTSVTTFNPTMSQVYLAVLIRLTAGAMGLNYSTIYATVIYWLLMGAAFYAITYGLYRMLGKKAVLLAGLLIPVLFGSYNLGWFNSLFSEATEMAGFLLVLGMSLVIMAKERGTVRWYVWLLFLISIRLFIGAKSQVTPEIMILGVWAIVLAFYHRSQKNSGVESLEQELSEQELSEQEKSETVRLRIKWAVQIFLVTGMVALIARSAVIIYQKDSAISSQDTTYSSIFSGVLMVAEDPVEALEELGLDESLIADAGKNPYLGEGAYYCQPRTEMAEEMIYSKVNTFNVLEWYLKHPDKLLYMLDHAAAESANPMPDYFLYVGEKTTQEHRTVSKFNLWSALRGSITPNYFWQYVVLYGAILIYCLIKLIRRSTTGKGKLLSGFMIVIVFAGALQFPLSVIGNGFIDNTKQLFMFRLIHDMIITVAAFTVFIKGRDWMRRYTQKMISTDRRLQDAGKAGEQQTNY